MGKKLYNEIVKAYLYVDKAIILVMALLVLSLNIGLGIACLVLFIASVIYDNILTSNYISQKGSEYEESFIREKDAMFRGFTENNPLLMCLVDMEGSVHWKNNLFSVAFPSEEDCKQVVTKDLLKAFDENPEDHVRVEFNNRIYRVSSAGVVHTDTDKMMLFFENVSAKETIKNLYVDSRPCIGFINIDNYDELMESTSTEDQAAIKAEIDKVLQTWVSGFDAALMRVRSNRYMLVFEQQHLEILKNTKFAILDRIREIETDADFPTTVSIGIAVGSTTLATMMDDALDALDLGLGRGGDQVVVKPKGMDAEFFGGALTTVEKRKKGKSRIISHALIQLIRNADQVIIMGHKRPDLDCYGAAIGLYALVRNQNIPVAIVLDTEYEAIELIHNACEATGDYVFYTPQQAAEKLTKNSLIIVEDAHIPFITEAPELLEKTKNIVVIDHHRKSPEAIDLPILSYMETYASSTSELVAEMLQYIGDKPSFLKFDFDALLSGMMVDTKNFTTNTGVRTFEAAAWLRRNGADVNVVQSFFKMRLESYQKKVNIIANAEILSNGVAVAYTKERDPGMQLLVAQAADELLDMRGVVAAFAAGYGENATMVSARSLNKVNVQTIMESMGGGGHLNMAAAQVEESPEEAIAKIVNYMRENGML